MLLDQRENYVFFFFPLLDGWHLLLLLLLQTFSWGFCLPLMQKVHFTHNLITVNWSKVGVEKALNNPQLINDCTKDHTLQAPSPPQLPSSSRPNNSTS